MGAAHKPSAACWLQPAGPLAGIFSGGVTSFVLDGYFRCFKIAIKPVASLS